MHVVLISIYCTLVDCNIQVNICVKYVVISLEFKLCEVVFHFVLFLSLMGNNILSSHKFTHSELL